MVVRRSIKIKIQLDSVHERGPVYDTIRNVDTSHDLFADPFFANDGVSTILYLLGAG